METKRYVIIFSAVILGLYAGHYAGELYLPDRERLKKPVTVSHVLRSIDQPAVSSEIVEDQTGEDISSDLTGAKEVNESELEGVNEQFRDKPKIQKAWIKRGMDITLKNHPDADAANYQGAFFHRGFKDKAVTCGEVEFLQGNNVLDDFQRFIFVGRQSTYFESKIPNFDLLWDKLCVQTYTE